MPKTIDDDILAYVEEIFGDRIPFNRLLGLRFELIDDETARLRFDMRDALVGNFVRGSLHGGVISSSLDVIGGAVAFLGAIKRMRLKSLERELERFGNLGTIDLRVDYLRPGLGRHFVATGYVLRTGSRVAVTRMELHNDEQRLIAVGTGAYVVG